jgi:hypothetical protein
MFGTTGLPVLVSLSLAAEKWQLGRERATRIESRGDVNGGAVL